jgi:hypothetical protein
MKTSFEVTDNVLIRRFTGDITQEDIIESWRVLFSRYPDLELYKGMIIDLLNARLVQDRNKFTEMVMYVKGMLDRVTDMKIAVVMDTPQVTQIILMDHMIQQLQIRPFATLKGAIDWINI